MGAEVTLTVGSLFSGIGGLELGLERAGMKTLWQVESDEYARKVLEKNWPKVRRYKDVRSVHALDHCNFEPGFRGCNEFCVSRVHVLCGGFPCQDISNAGKKAGIEGERSGLWSEFHRLIRELRPEYVIVENVAAILVRGIDRVLGDLAASGFDAEWDCIPAAAVGAPHRRDRLFIVAYAAGKRRRKGWARGPSCGGSDRQTERAQTLAHAACFGRAANATGGATHAPKPDPWWSAEPNVGRVANGVPARVDRLRCLGNAVVPQVAELIGRRIIARESSAVRVD